MVQILMTFLTRSKEWWFGLLLIVAPLTVGVVAAASFHWQIGRQQTYYVEEIRRIELEAEVRLAMYEERLAGQVRKSHYKFAKQIDECKDYILELYYGQDHEDYKDDEGNYPSITSSKLRGNDKPSSTKEASGSHGPKGTKRVVATPPK